MSIFSDQSNMFPFSNKGIQFGNKNVGVISGSKTLAAVDLCNVNIPYENYQKISIKILPGMEDFILDFPTLGNKPTFLMIVAKYCDKDPNNQFMYWNFIHSADAPNVMTNIMVLTGTSNNPIPKIKITNPSEKCPIMLDILVAGDVTDFSDTEQYIYIGDLTFCDIYLYDDGILGIKNEEAEEDFTINIANIINFIKMDDYKIKIDDNTDHDIVLGFKTCEDVCQAISILNYIVNNPTDPDDLFGETCEDRKDINPPIIIFNEPPVDVNNNTAAIQFDFEYDELTKDDIIQLLIHTVIDDRDGLIQLQPSNVTIFDVNLNNTIPIIVESGIYEITFEVSDLACNKTIKTITLTIDDIYYLINNIYETLIDDEDNKFIYE